jgi:hypothetical protein
MIARIAQESRARVSDMQWVIHLSDGGNDEFSRIIETLSCLQIVQIQPYSHSGSRAKGRKFQGESKSRKPNKNPLFYYHFAKMVRAERNCIGRLLVIRQ